MPVSVSCGAHHTAVITRRGDLITWGAGTAGQTGQGFSTDVCSMLKYCSVHTYNCMSYQLLRLSQVLHLSVNQQNWCLSPKIVVQTQSPKKVQFRGDDQKNITVRIVACAGGGNETVAIDEKGGLWGCGQNASAQLGLGQGGIVPAFQNISITERSHRYDKHTHQRASSVCCSYILSSAYSCAVTTGSLPQL